MPASFLGLPAELRNEIYKHLLVFREPIDFWSRQYGIVLNLLLTNSMILHEAGSLLYSNNCFDLTARSPSITSQYLNNIGLVNASRLEHIRLNFPEFCDIKAEIRLQKYLRTLNNIQTRCTSLKSITLAPPIFYFTGIRRDLVDNRDRTLGLIASRLRPITSLQKIVLEVYEGDIDPGFREQIQIHGWTPKVIERVEEDWEADGCLDELDYPYEIDDDYDNDDDF